MTHVETSLTLDQQAAVNQALVLLREKAGMSPNAKLRDSTVVSLEVLAQEGWLRPPL